MQDELLIKFIDGKCSPEETEEVIRELSQEGGDSREWLQMQAASSLVGTKPFETVRTADARRFVSGVIARDQIVSPRRKALRWTGFAAGFCAMAAAVALIFTVGRTGKGPGLPETGDSLAYVDDSLGFASGQTEREISTEEICETETRETEMPRAESARDEQERTGTSELVPQPATSIAYDRNAVLGEATDTTANQRMLKMIRPSKSPYRIKVIDLSKEFVFKWEAPEAAKASLLIKDGEGITLVDESIEELTESRIPIGVITLTDKGELTWTLTLEYPDGGTVSRTGR
ncbi:MAG: hypothetical protein ACI3ZP_04025, partial [Candidatus Cryptobacteroides sp.]